MTNAEDILATGVPGLDTLLAGGLDRPALAVIVGPPGAGKTLLASQILFHAARQGFKSLVVTSYSEGNEQYIQHMRSLAFFDAGLLGDSVQILTLASLLTETDETPAGAITQAIRSSGAKLVLLDGFQNANPLLPGEHEVRALLAALAIQIRYLDATILVTIAGEPRDPTMYSEMTVADVAIGLRYTVQGRRHQRLLEVVKLRGRGQQPGLHSYRITSRGMEIFPRIEGLRIAAQRPRTSERAPFHLPELDQLLGGGPNVGTTTLLAGAPSVGKTTLGLHWALGEAAADSVSVFVSFSEQPEQLERKAAAFGLNLRPAIASGAIRVLRFAPTELDPDAVAAALAEELASPSVSRLIIDDISVLLHELGERARDYLGALNDLVYATNVTGLFLMEIPPFEGLRVPQANTSLAALGDALIVVQQYEIADELRRLIAVLRMRLSFFDRTLRELVIDTQGIRILAPEASALGLLATGARLSGGVAPHDTRPENSGETTGG
jgi:circadian clock protein KaiC